ncbi:MAG: hypothetical protein E7474_06595 [Ruminococcaceae bacterium]|nr:hypothetical protein [Oscillospiraceae bacterium]
MLERYHSAGALGNRYESTYAFGIPLLIGNEKEPFDLILFGREWEDDRSRLAEKIDRIERLVRERYDDVLEPLVHTHIVPHLIGETETEERDQALVEGLTKLHDACVKLAGREHEFGNWWTLCPYLIRKAETCESALAGGEDCWNLPWEKPADERQNFGFLLRYDWENTKTACFIQCLCEEADKEQMRKNAFFTRKNLRLIIDFIAKEGNLSIAHDALSEWEQEAFGRYARNSTLVTEVIPLREIDRSETDSSGKTNQLDLDTFTKSYNVSKFAAIAKSLEWKIETGHETISLFPPADNTWCKVVIRKDASSDAIMDTMFRCLRHHAFDDVGEAVQKLILRASV